MCVCACVCACVYFHIALCVCVCVCVFPELKKKMYCYNFKDFLLDAQMLGTVKLNTERVLLIKSACYIYFDTEFDDQEIFSPLIESNNLGLDFNENRSHNNPLKEIM